VAQRLSEYLAVLATDPQQLAAYLQDREQAIRAADLDADDTDALTSGDPLAIQQRLLHDAARLGGSVHVPPPPSKEPTASVHVPPPPTEAPATSVHVPPPPTASVHVPPKPASAPVPPPPTASVHVTPTSKPTAPEKPAGDDPKPPTAE
jgi:hypothetical protein